MAQGGNDSGLGSGGQQFQFDQELYEALIGNITETVIGLYQKNQSLGEAKQVMVLTVDQVTKLATHAANYAAAKYLEKLEEQRIQNEQQQLAQALAAMIGLLAAASSDDDSDDGTNVNDHSTKEIQYPWKKEEILGRGAFGVVFRARGPDGFQFAVKEGEENQQQTSLLEEIKCLINLSHPNIVRCFGFAEGGGKIYMYLELMAGSIADRMKTNSGPCNILEARRHTVDVVRGLIYLHKKDIVHRDIKCANILLDSDGTAKLGDMGLSKVGSLQQTVAEYGDVGGSILWMSPEALTEKMIGKRADIWSLGCSIYEMLKSEPPFANLGILKFLLLQSQSSQGGCSGHRQVIERDEVFQGDLKVGILIRDPLEDRITYFLKYLCHFKRDRSWRILLVTPGSVSPSCSWKTRRVPHAPSNNFCMLSCTTSRRLL